MDVHIQKPGFTNHERAWLQGAEAAVRQGGARLSDCLSDHGGRSPVDRHWISIANAITATTGNKVRSKAPTRAAMMRAWLEHPDRPQILPHLQNTLLCEAVRNRAHECIPLLHAAGFVIEHDGAGQQLLAKELKAGRWPWPDLLAPDIASCRDYHAHLSDGVFSSPALRSNTYASRLSQLTPDAWLTRRISRQLGRGMGITKTWTPSERGQAIAALTVLGRSKWLDLGQASRAAHEANAAASTHALIADIQTRVLEADTPAAPVCARRAPRL